MNMKKNLLSICISLLTIFGQAQMNGTYYVEAGNATAYQTIGDAITALETQGVDGFVTIILKDGVYNEQIVIPEITGVSAANTIVFTTLEGEKALIQYNAPDNASNFVLKFDGAKRILFENISIESLSSSFGKVIQMSNETRYVSLSNLELKAHSEANNDVIEILDYDAEYIYISNCEIINGFNGISVLGTSVNKIEEITIKDNILKNSKKACIVATMVSNLTVSGNTIIVDEASSTFYQGLHFTNVYDYSIYSNSISIPRNVGISLSYCAQSLTKAYVANNIISVRGDGESTTDVGIQLKNGGRQEIYNNTIVIGADADDSRGIYFIDASGFGSQNSIINNNVVNLAGGYAIDIEDLDVATIKTFDFNNLYSTGTQLGKYHGSDAADLEAWKTLSGFDAHSITTNPQFTDTSFTISCNYALDSAATPLWLTDDFYGNDRDATNPDIGAIEFSEISVDLGVDTVKICEGGSITLDAGKIPFAKYNWAHGGNTQTIDVTEEGTYKVTILHPCKSASDSVFVNVLDIPQNLNLADTIKICTGAAAHIEVPTFEEATYTWSSGQSINFIDVSTEEMYKVTVSNFCGTKADSTYLNVENCASGLEESSESKISIYPNPIQNQLTIDLIEKEEAEILVFKIDGSIYKTFQNSESELVIDCSDWQAGTYILQVKTNTKVLTNRIIKL